MEATISPNSTTSLASWWVSVEAISVPVDELDRIEGIRNGQNNIGDDCDAASEAYSTCLIKPSGVNTGVVKS
jgi:hypothetical protein